MRGCVCVCVLTAWHYANKLDLQHVVSSIATEVKIFVVQRGRGYAKCLQYSLVQDDSKRKGNAKLNYTAHARKGNSYTHFKEAWKLQCLEILYYMNLVFKVNFFNSNQINFKRPVL